MKRAALIFAALAVAFAAPAAPVRTATENFVTNKIAEAVATIPAAIAAAAQAATNYTDAAVANYKPKQTAKASPSAASTEAYQFVDTISQDTDGVITATKKTMRKATTSAPGMVQLNDNINSTRTDHAATANAVRKVAELAQAALTTETDPTVPQWAKAQTKPTYTASEVGAVSTSGGTVTSDNGVLIVGKTAQTGTIQLWPYFGSGMVPAIDLETFNGKRGIYYVDGIEMQRRDGSYHFLEFPYADGVLALTSDIPTVPAWAMAETKPTYTAGEVGATTPEDLTSATNAVLSAATNYTESARIATVEYIVSPETARGTVYTGVSQDTELRDGKVIYYYMPYHATGNWTLNLQLADGTWTGAKPTYYWGTSQISTRYGANSIIPLVYRNGAWYCSDYNTDANNYDRNVVTYCKAAEAFAANVLTVGTTNGYYKLAAGRTFDLDLPILFCNGAQTVGKTNGNNWYSNYNGVNLATTLAGWAGDATTRGKPVFLCGTVNDADRTFTISDTPFSLDCTPPCICLGWYNANANGSFCFLPSGLIRDDLATKQWVDDEIRSLSLGGIWDEALQVWWTPVMRNGSLTYQATTNVNLNAEN